MNPMPSVGSAFEIHANDQRILTRLYKKEGLIEVYSRHFEIGDYGPDMWDLAKIALQEFSSRAGDLEHNNPHMYINPAWTVTAPSATDELTFIKEAEKACIHWMTRLRHTLGYGRVNRMLRDMNPNARVLASCGVLFLSGKEAHPKRLNWRAKQNPKKTTR
jgi:hypothetical protein